MKKLFFIAIAIWVSVSSCSKNGQNDQLQKPPVQTEENYYPIKHGGPAKKEETRPIVILKPVRPNGTALPSLIMLIKGTETLYGQTSNNNPEFTFYLPEDGEWLVNISSQGYIPLNAPFNYVDSFVYQVDTLQPAQ